MRRHRYTGKHAHQDSAVPRTHTHITVTNSHTYLQSRTSNECRAPPLILALTPRKRFTNSYTYNSHELTHLPAISHIKRVQSTAPYTRTNTQKKRHKSSPRSCVCCSVCCSLCCSVCCSVCCGVHCSVCYRVRCNVCYSVCCSVSDYCSLSHAVV